ncbi:MAG: hypothetical protein GDA49_12325 [Rhodospirillales bacterium]|nr:hypothetical protein [Rhodospirillales bacterium]
MSDLDHLLADLGRTVALPFEQATTLPSGVYNGAAFTAREIKHLFKSDRVCVGRTDEVWDCNWKSLAENFTESYHLFSSHKHTLQPFTPTQGSGANRARQAGTSTGWTPAACRRRSGPTPTTTHAPASR